VPSALNPTGSVGATQPPNANESAACRPSSTLTACAEVKGAPSARSRLPICVTAKLGECRRLCVQAPWSGRMSKTMRQPPASHFQRPAYTFPASVKGSAGNSIGTFTQWTATRVRSSAALVSAPGRYPKPLELVPTAGIVTAPIPGQANCRVVGPSAQCLSASHSTSRSPLRRSQMWPSAGLPEPMTSGPRYNVIGAPASANPYTGSIGVTGWSGCSPAERTLQRTGTALVARGYILWRVTRGLRGFIRTTRLTHPRARQLLRALGEWGCDASRVDADRAG
jgi:hypothetical protein